MLWWLLDSLLESFVALDDLDLFASILLHFLNESISCKMVGFDSSRSDVLDRMATLTGVNEAAKLNIVGRLLTWHHSHFVDCGLWDVSIVLLIIYNLLRILKWCILIEVANPFHLSIGSCMAYGYLVVEVASI